MRNPVARIGSSLLGMALVLGGLGLPVQPSAALTVNRPAATKALPVEGYLMDQDTALSHLRANINAIATVGLDGVSLTKNGAGLTATPDNARAVVRLAHRHGVKVELLVSNYSEALGDFSPAIAGRLLTSSAHRARVARTLADRVRRTGFDGVQIDLESLKASHRFGLTAFVKQLRRVLPAKKRISMAVMASTKPSLYRDSGYQLGKLRALVNRFVLMAYDQHGPSWSSAGPVGGTPWVKAVLRGFRAAGLPASRIDLGVAQYGYRWPGDGSTGNSLSVAQARALAGERAVFDPVQQEWTATLADGTKLWWSDRDTLRSRRSLAQAAGLHGLAVWELSLADPLS